MSQRGDRLDLRHRGHAHIHLEIAHCGRSPSLCSAVLPVDRKIDRLFVAPNPYRTIDRYAYSGRAELILQLPYLALRTTVRKQDMILILYLSHLRLLYLWTGLLIGFFPKPCAAHGWYGYRDPILRAHQYG